MTSSVFEETRAELGRPIHVRNYRVEVFRKPPTEMRLVGEVVDTKPDGLTAEDPDPLDVHRMSLVVDVTIPDLTITHCEAGMTTHPHEECPTIVEAYEQVVGLSIARGFTHAVRERLGGPRACTHITILLQAMAPVAWQGIFSYPEHMDFPDEGTPAHRRWMEIGMQMNRNSCHMFADGGIMESHVKEGTATGPLWAVARKAELDARLSSD